MRRLRPSLALILVLVFAAGPLFAGSDREVSPSKRAAAVEVLVNLWYRLTAVFAALGPEMDPGGTPAPSIQTEVTTPLPAALGPGMDPTG